MTTRQILLVPVAAVLLACPAWAERAKVHVQFSFPARPFGNLLDDDAPEVAALVVNGSPNRGSAETPGLVVLLQENFPYIHFVPGTPDSAPPRLEVELGCEFPPESKTCGKVQSTWKMVGADEDPRVLSSEYRPGIDDFGVKVTQPSQRVTLKQQHESLAAEVREDLAKVIEGEIKKLAQDLFSIVSVSERLTPVQDGTDQFWYLDERHCDLGLGESTKFLVVVRTKSSPLPYKCKTELTLLHRQHKGHDNHIQTLVEGTSTRTCRENHTKLGSGLILEQATARVVDFEQMPAGNCRGRPPRR